MIFKTETKIYILKRIYKSQILNCRNSQNYASFIHPRKFLSYLQVNYSCERLIFYFKIKAVKNHKKKSL